VRKRGGNRQITMKQFRRDEEKGAAPPRRGPRFPLRKAYGAIRQPPHARQLNKGARELTGDCPARSAAGST
jgi:hypothetical protein